MSHIQGFKNVFSNVALRMCFKLVHIVCWKTHFKTLPTTLKTIFSKHIQGISKHKNFIENVITCIQPWSVFNKCRFVVFCRKHRKNYLKINRVCKEFNNYIRICIDVFFLFKIRTYIFLLNLMFYQQSKCHRIFSEVI